MIYKSGIGNLSQEGEPALYLKNLFSFSILLTNSIVQDGHGMLPLPAESRKDFLKVKTINMLPGLLVGNTLLRLNL